MSTQEQATEVIWQQARLIHETIHLLRASMLTRHGRKCPACEGAPELTVAQANAVMIIRDRGQVSVTDLAHALGVSAPSASIMVDRLVEMGVLTREQNPADRREVVIRLASKMDEHFEVFERHVLDFFVDLLKHVGPEHARMWTEVYSHVREVIESGALTRSDPS